MLFVASCNPHLDLLHSLLDITQLLITKVCAWRKCAGEYKPDHGEFGIKQYASSALEHLWYAHVGSTYISSQYSDGPRVF